MSTPRKLTNEQQEYRDSLFKNRKTPVMYGVRIREPKKEEEKPGRNGNPKKKLDDLFKHQTYYGNLKQFKTNIYQWIRSGVIKGIEMEKGYLWLSSAKIEENKEPQLF